MAELTGDSQTGIGVEGTSDVGHGVVGRSNQANGVVGHSSGDPGSGAAGVFGEHLADGTGVTGRSRGGFGVAGISDGSRGVFGESQGGFGVEGVSRSGHGLVGRSAEANGVVGHSSADPGSGAAGVFGEHLANGTGVVGRSQDGFGVAGLSQSSRAVSGESATGIGVFGKGGQLAALFDGDVEVTGDIRLSNADCAEDFDVHGSDPIEPGTVMILGDHGELHESDQPYDRRVAGVISGAGTYKPALVLDRRAVPGRQPIALVGKVYCKVDAHHGAIAVGDLLTTSPEPGYAMKASDHQRAFGAVIGKALRPHADGKGLIPVLIALQ